LAFVRDDGLGLVRIPHWAAASEYRFGTRELLGGKWTLKQSDLGMTIEAVSREAFEAQLKSVRVLAFGEREGRLRSGFSDLAG